jgi:hypothetical protein
MPSIEPQTELRSPAPAGEKAALRWASLLCGRENVAGLSLLAAHNQVRAWADAFFAGKPGMFSGELQRVPEPFLTTRFLAEVRFFNQGLEQLKELVQPPHEFRQDFVQAMTRVSQIFQGDEARLTHWRELGAEFPGFMPWLSTFANSYEYLRSAFPTAVEQVEETRKDLLKMAAEPHQFLYTPVREGFDCGFEAYRKGYGEFYCSAHDDAVHIVGNQAKLESRVDSVALRNLELLSDLDGADRSYLNRARAIGKWVQARQCSLPVRQILIRHPHCYCNFNPKGSGRLTGAIDQLNDAIREGIAHFRSLLRDCRVTIIQELKDRGIDDSHSKPIAALLSRGPMIPLKQQSVDILNAAIQKRPATAGAGHRRHRAGALLPRREPD